MTTLKELMTELLVLSERLGPDTEVQILGEQFDWTTNFATFEAPTGPYGSGGPDVVRIEAS
jgi:hypothetical protein